MEKNIRVVLSDTGSLEHLEEEGGKIIHQGTQLTKFFDLTVNQTVNFIGKLSNALKISPTEEEKEEVIGVLFKGVVVCIATMHTVFEGIEEREEHIQEQGVNDLASSATSLILSNVEGLDIEFTNAPCARPGHPLSHMFRDVEESLALNLEEVINIDADKKRIFVRKKTRGDKWKSITFALVSSITVDENERARDEYKRTLGAVHFKKVKRLFSRFEGSVKAIYLALYEATIEHDDGEVTLQPHWKDSLVAVLSSKEELN